jgi:hypothetical protein
MILTDTLCCSATIQIDVDAAKLLKFISDPIKLGDWAFGSFKPTESHGNNIFSGTSLYDGGKTSYRINVYEKFRQVDYEVGYLGGELLPWIVGRVIPGPVVGLPAGTSLLTMLAWRHKDWSDEDWRLVCASHEAEVFRVRYLVESEK